MHRKGKKMPRLEKEAIVVNPFKPEQPNIGARAYKDDRGGIGIGRLGMIEESVREDGSIGGRHTAHYWFKSSCYSKRVAVNRSC
jgi:hypothetical protein